MSQMKQHTSSTLSKYGVLAFCLPLILGASFADQNFPFIHFGIMSSFCYHWYKSYASAKRISRYFQSGKKLSAFYNFQGEF